MRYDAEHKARTRERVLKEAAKAIRRDGPQGVGVVSAMSAAGLTAGGFYAHFASREALVAEALDHTFHDAAVMFERRTGGRPPGEALERYIRFYLSAAHRDARDAGCPLPALGGDVSRMDATARGRYGAGAEGLRKRLQGLLEGLGRADADVLAGSVLAELVGALAVARALPPGPAADAVLRRSREALLARCGLERGAGAEA